MPNRFRVSGLYAAGRALAGLLLGALCLSATVVWADAPTPPVSMLWRSALYPENWTPGYRDSEGRFLHDFSYAGYHNGQAPLPVGAPGTIFNVAAGFGADNTGATDATAAIQAAIDAAETEGGGVVYFPPGLYRCDDRITITGSHIVLRGDGPDASRIYFTSFADMKSRGHITFSGALSSGPHLPLVADGANEAFYVDVADASGLSVGDDVSIGWVTGDAFYAEHGMTDTWVPSFKDLWWAFFRCEVQAIEPQAGDFRVRVDVPLRYAAKMRDAASLRRETGYMEECGIESLGIANAVNWVDAWGEDRNRDGIYAIVFQYCKDCWAKDVRTFVSPADPEGLYHLQNSGLKVLASKRFTAADCRMEKAQNRGDGGVGYLFAIYQSNEILFRDCAGVDGRHNFIQNWGFGTSGCVFLRCFSAGGRGIFSVNIPFGSETYSEYHHALAMACLVDDCVLEDGWYGGNRKLWSSGAGHTCTENAYWNIRGGGTIESFAYQWGYVIGTENMQVKTAMFYDSAEGTEPEDYVEGAGIGALLRPRSLYEDQLARRQGQSGEAPCTTAAQLAALGSGFTALLAQFADTTSLDALPAQWSTFDLENAAAWLDWYEAWTAFNAGTGPQPGPEPALGDGLPDAWQMALLAEVLCATSPAPKSAVWWALTQSVRDAYENNRQVWIDALNARLAAETDPARIALFEDLRDTYAPLLAGLLGLSQDAQAAYLELLAPLGIAGAFEILGGVGEPFHALSDLDGDGVTNLREYQYTLDDGGGMDEYVQACLYQQNETRLPASDTLGLVALALTILAAGLRAARFEFSTARRRMRW